MAEMRSAKVIPVLLHYKNYFVMFCKLKIFF